MFETQSEVEQFLAVAEAGPIVAAAGHGTYGGGPESWPAEPMRSARWHGSR